MLFFAALLYLMWRTLKVMPRVKPQQIKPASNQSVTPYAHSNAPFTDPCGTTPPGMAAVVRPLGV